MTPSQGLPGQWEGRGVGEETNPDEEVNQKAPHKTQRHWGDAGALEV